MKKVAVIGSGISGTSAAFYLNKLGYDVYLFESGSYFGGHTNTIDVDFGCLLYTSPSPRDRTRSRMPSSA